MAIGSFIVGYGDTSLGGRQGGSPSLALDAGYEVFNFNDPCLREGVAWISGKRSRSSTVTMKVGT